jgi:hypothetical protein
LEHDSQSKKSKKPYLGIAQPDIHNYDGESLPSDNEPTIELSDEEPTAPHPASEEPSNEEPMQRLTSPIEQVPPLPTTSGTSEPYSRTKPPRLLPANTHHSSITTIHQEQQLTTADMVTTITTATAATTTTRPGMPPPTNTTTTVSTCKAPEGF